MWACVWRRGLTASMAEATSSGLIGNDMIQKGNISQALMSSASNAARTNFDIQFHSIEKTVVKRMNKEIDKIVSQTSRHRDVEVLNKQYNKLTDELPLYKTYLFGNEGNQTRLQDMGDVINDIVAVFETGDTSLNAAQASDINANVEDVIERISKLVPVSHPDIEMPDVVFRLRGLKEGFEDYKAEAGGIDAAGSTTFTNDNRQLYDAMAELQSWVNTATTITGNTVDYTSNLIVDTQTELFEIEGRMTEIQTADTARVKSEVADIKERYSHLLQAISLSFEASSGFTDYIQKGLGQQKNPPGSILNIFG